MAPPLVQLSDIALTFGGTPLLDGAELSVSTGERVSLVGRNGSGKSTLLKIAAKLVEPDRGQVFVQPGAVVRYLPQEPDFAGFATTLAYVEAGLRPTDDPYVGPQYLLEQLGLTGAEVTPRTSPAARRAAPRWPMCWRPTRTSCCSTSRPTISTSPRSNGWSRTWTRGTAHRAGLHHQPRPALPVANLVERHGFWLDRGRTAPWLEPGLREVRGLARYGAGR